MDALVYGSSRVAQLRLEGVHKQLGGKPVVNGVDLTVDPGESIVLLGPSGCGKSTTLRMVAGFIEPDAGTISIEGKLVSGSGVSIPTEKRRLGMVFQSYAVWPHKTVYENVAFGLKIAGESRANVQQKVTRVLEMVQLDRLSQRYPSELSGGQQQRVALARAIVGEPRLLLLDEPLSNLDASLREELRAELRKVHKANGITTLYVTHDQEEALVLADRIAVMDNGKIVQFDEPEAIYKRPATRFVASFVGSPNLVPGKIVGKHAVANRVSVETDFGIIVDAGAAGDHIAAWNIGDGVTVVIRPEDLRFNEDHAGLNSLITDVAFLGTSYETTLDVRGLRLKARTRARPAHYDGLVTISTAPESTWVVP